jgi:hypothetical protein
MMLKAGRRFMRILALALAATLACIAAVRAADWVERPYDPPAGSHWIIQSEDVTEADTNGQHVQSSLTTTAELIFEQKTAEGFRVTYIMRSAAYDGDARTARSLVRQVRRWRTLPFMRRLLQTACLCASKISMRF